MSKKLLWILFSAGLAAAGCAMLLGGGASAPSPRGFRHKSHLAKGAGCDDCHPGVTKAGEPAIALKFCMECHNQAPKGGGLDPTLKDYAQADGKTGMWRVFAGVPEEIHFSHAAHVGAYKLECAQCHGKVAEDDLSVSARAGGMDACMACHESKAVKTACADCHKVIRKDARPPSHTAAWGRMHGVAAKGRGLTALEKEGRCSLCHQQNTCAACHQKEMPRDHTTFWTRRGHGLAAESADRGRCQTCHQQDFCIRCHSSTTPATHVGAWGTARQTHCLSCHGGTAVTNCATCHAGAVASHPIGPRQPSFHATFTDAVCRSCHRSLAHLDNGGACSACHPK